MNSILSMAAKDLLLLWRDKFAMFWILAFPLTFALFFGAIFGGSGGGAAIRVAIVDLDSSDASRSFVDSLSENEAILIVPREDGSSWTRQSARDTVRKGDVVAYVLIPEGYGRGGPTSMFSPDAPSLEVGIDPVRRAERGMLQGVLAQASFGRMGAMFSDPASMLPDIEQFRDEVKLSKDRSTTEKQALLGIFDSLKGLANSADALRQYEAEAGDGERIASQSFDPIKIDFKEVSRPNARPASPFEISFPQAMVWGIIGCATGFAITLVQEKTRGTWIRLRVAPQSLWQILAGKGLACFLACVGTITLLLLIGNLLFSVRIASPAGLVMGVVSIGVCFTGMMMVIATIGRTEQAVAGAGWAAMMPLAMVGGGMIPLFLMPHWMATLSNISPVKWAVLAMEGAIWRGFSLTEMALPSAVLLGIGLVCFSLGAFILTRRES